MYMYMYIVSLAHDQSARGQSLGEDCKRSPGDIHVKKSKNSELIMGVKKRKEKKLMSAKAKIIIINY